MIEITVSYHTSGTRTLMRRDLPAMKATDVPAPSILNREPAEFYRFVADYLGDLANQGLAFTYRDGSPPVP